MRRFALAVVVATTGTAVFFALAHGLRGLVGSPLQYTLCAVTAFAATVWQADKTSRSFPSNLLPALLITAFTYAAIGAPEGIAEMRARKGDPSGLLNWSTVVFWAVVTTSWWVVPGTAGLITVFNRLSGGRVTADPGAA